MTTHEIKEDLIFDEMDDGNLINYFHLSNSCDDGFYHDAFYDFVLNSDDEVCIQIKFDVENVLSSMIWAKEHGDGSKIIGMEDKPLFDELRRKCTSMIAAIDGLEFINTEIDDA